MITNRLKNAGQTTRKLKDDVMDTLAGEEELNMLKSRFVTMASHEFRTPLTTILSSVFLLENYTGPGHETGRRIHINRIKRSVNTLNELLDDFLSLGKLEEGKIKPSYRDIDVERFMHDFLDEMELVREVGQKIDLRISAEHRTIHTDEKLLKDVLAKVLSNAIKYSSPDSPIYLEVTEEKNKMIFNVIDQGIGIPEHECREIFQRFYRAENAVHIEGTGLGLHIVKKYLKLLKGSITFKSELNKGTTFTIVVPRT